MHDAPPPSRPIEALLEDRDWVRVMARRLVRDPGRAEDLEQQAWLAALRRPLADGRSPRGWFATVLRRAAGRGRRDDWRRDRRERAAARPESGPSTVDVVAQAEWHARVVRAVLELPEPYRTTVLLRYLEDLPPREVARRMDAPVETVRSRAQRAIVLLRERFDAERGGRGGWAPAVAALAANAPSPGPAEDASWDGPHADAPRGTPAPAVPTGARSTMRLAPLVAALALVAVGVVAWIRGAFTDEAAPPIVSARGAGDPGAASDGGVLAARPAAALPVPAAPPAGPVRVAGRVVRDDDGQPAAGVRVIAVPLDAAVKALSWVEAVTDADGRYAVPETAFGRGAAAHDVMVIAMAEDHGTAGLGGIEPFGWNPFASGGTAANLDLRLVRATRFHGRVVGPDGKPAEGAVVEAWWRFPASGAALPFARPLSTTTADAEGRFSFSGWASQLGDVVARQPGSFASRIRDMSAGSLPDGGYEVYEAHAIPASRALAIEVVGPDGQPCPGAELCVRERGLHSHLAWERPFETWLVSGPDGRAAVASAPDVPIVVEARPPDAFGDPYQTVFGDAEPGATHVRIELRTADDPGAGARANPPPAFARVLDPDGATLRDVRFVRWLDGEHAASGVGQGTWSRLDVRPDERAEKPEGLSGFLEIAGARRAADGEPLAATFRALSDAPDVVVRLVPDVTVEGVVEGPPGASLVGTLVRARPVRWDGKAPREEHCVASARVDARGAFRLRGLGDEPYRLTVAAPPGLVLSGGSVLVPAAGGRVALRLVPGK